MRPLLFISLFVTAGALPEIIDRVAVAVENSVITESEILRQIRLTALINGEKPDFSGANKRDTAERLIEQMLIRREIEQSGYSSNSSARTDALYQAFRERFPSDAAYDQALQEYGVSDEEVRDAFRWQATLLDFIEVRFRPGVQVSEEDIRFYYEERMSAAGKPDVPLEEVRPKIEEILMQERVDNALDRWLGQARTQTRIRYKQEVFQ